MSEIPARRQRLLPCPPLKKDSVSAVNSSGSANPDHRLSSFDFPGFPMVGKKMGRIDCVCLPFRSLWHSKCFVLSMKMNDRPWRPANEKISGFTLLEIVIVVSIVGLLAALGTLGYTKSMRNSRINVAKSELEMIAAATLQLAWDTGKWPNGAWRNESASGANEISDLTGGPLFSIREGDIYPEWKGPYYEGSLVDPWGKSYYFDSDYRVDGVNRIVVGSGGPNGSGINRYDEDNIYVFLDD